MSPTRTKPVLSPEQVEAVEREKRLRAIATTLNDDKKGFGEGTVVIASEILPPPPRLSTGSTSIDLALGGGWPPNQWNEVIGIESSGKTGLALQTVLANQGPDFWTVWIAAEGFDVGYAELCGVDMDHVLVVNTNIMEEAYQAVLDYLESHDVDLVVIDSLPALSPQSEWDRDLDQRSPGLGAFLTGLFFRKSYKATKRSLIVEERPVFGLMINQYRSKIGVQYGDPRTTPGGEGKNYRFYTRVEVRRDEFITTKARGEGDKVGQSIKVRTVKNKSAPPQQVAVVDFYFAPWGGHLAGRWDTVKEVANLAMQFEIVQRHGSNYSYGEAKFKGKDPLFEAIGTDADLHSALRADVLAYIDKERVVLPDDPEMAEEEEASRRAAALRLQEAEDAADPEPEETEEDREAKEKVANRKARKAASAPAAASTKTTVRRRARG